LVTAPSRWTRAFPAAATVPAGPARRGDKLEILAHTHPAGSTDRFSAELADRAVRTLTDVAGDQTKAIALVFAL
jgi:acyl-ACP thioesterase